MNRQLRDNDNDDDLEADTSMTNDVQERMGALDLQLERVPSPLATSINIAHYPCHDDDEEERNLCQSPKLNCDSCSIQSDIQKHQRQPKSVGKKQFSVRFSEPLYSIAELIPMIDDIPRKERHDIWWTARDFHTFRMAAKKVSYDLQRLDKNTIERHLETGGYSKANLLATTTVVDELALEDFLTTGILQSMPFHVERLVGWTHRSQGRGLEHWTSRIHHLYRREAIHESRNIILSLTSDQETPQEVVKQYQEQSRAARILARLIAEADAITAQQVHAEEGVDVNVVNKPIGGAVAAETMASVAAASTTQRQTSPTSSLLSSSSGRSSIASRTRRSSLDRKLPVQHRGIA